MEIKVRTEYGLQTIRPWVYLRSPDGGTLTANLFTLAESDLHDGITITEEEMVLIRKFWTGLQNDIHLRATYRNAAGVKIRLEMVIGGFTPGEGGYAEQPV